MLDTAMLVEPPRLAPWQANILKGCSAKQKLIHFHMEESTVNTELTQLSLPAVMSLAQWRAVEDKARQDTLKTIRPPQ